MPWSIVSFMPEMLGAASSLAETNTLYCLMWNLVSIREGYIA